MLGKLGRSRDSGEARKGGTLLSNCCAFVKIVGGAVLCPPSSQYAKACGDVTYFTKNRLMEAYFVRVFYTNSNSIITLVRYEKFNW